MKHFFFILAIFVSVVASSCGLLVEQGRAVLAKVGDEPIRLDDLLERIRSLPFEQRAATNDPNASVRMQARRSLLEQIITERLLIQEAKARNIAVSDDEVESALKARDDRTQAASQVREEGMGGSSAHEHGHEEATHSRSEINDMRLQLMVKKMLDSEMNEDTRRRYYDEHHDQFLVNPPQVMFELLIVDDAHTGILKEVSDRARRENTTLTAALASAPDAKSVTFCGEMPPAPLNRLVPVMRENIQKLSAGQISEPFILSTGTTQQHAVTRLVGYIDTVPYERARMAINKKLYDSFLEGLRQKYEVVYYKDKLDYRLEG